jgi:hypothetical protein
MNNIEMDRMIARLLSCTKDFNTYMGAGDTHSIERILEYSRRIFKASGMLGREASILSKQMKANEFFEPPVRAHNFSGADPLPSCTDRQPPEDYDMGLPGDHEASYYENLDNHDFSDEPTRGES